jgi:hypothetical protein
VPHGLAFWCVTDNCPRAPRSTRCRSPSADRAADAEGGLITGQDVWTFGAVFSPAGGGVWCKDQRA